MRNTVDFVAGGVSYHSVGDRVNVRFYDYDARATAELDEFGPLWTRALAIAAGGLSVLLAGLFVTRRYRER